MVLIYMSMKRRQVFLNEEKTITIPEGWLEYWKQKCDEPMIGVMISYDQGPLIIEPVYNPDGIKIWAV